MAAGICDGRVRAEYDRRNLSWESSVAERTGRRPLKVGLFLFFAPFWAEVRQLAERAEAVGYDSVWVMDHLIMRNDSQTTLVWEGWSLLTALAVATRRIELGMLVLATSFRNPALL